jgi:hypothetical protein
MGERIDRFRKYVADNEVNKKVKTHLEEHKLLYCCIGSAVAGAGIGVLWMKKNPSWPNTNDIKVKAGRDAIVAGKNVMMKNVTFITANRQGPPSWVVRCIETGSIFPSQNNAASQMNLSAAHISEHLNGVRDHVNGYTFERICLAA